MLYTRTCDLFFSYLLSEAFTEPCSQVCVTFSVSISTLSSLLNPSVDADTLTFYSCLYFSICMLLDVQIR